LVTPNEPEAIEREVCKKLSLTTGHISVIYSGDPGKSHLGVYEYKPVRSAGSRSVLAVIEPTQEKLNRFYDKTEDPFFTHYSEATRYWWGQKDDDDIPEGLLDSIIKVIDSYSQRFEESTEV
jgi:hypothetical protein|tara:strand:- start:3325 stop:3690 length:366 start_codon:yes stop_codon:yes gene_type:complete